MEFTILFSYLKNCSSSISQSHSKHLLSEAWASLGVSLCCPLSLDILSLSLLIFLHVQFHLVKFALGLNNPFFSFLLVWINVLHLLNLSIMIFCVITLLYLVLEVLGSLRKFYYLFLLETYWVYLIRLTYETIPWSKSN